MMTVQALKMLQNDPETEVIAVISKSPGCRWPAR
jgi:succinyl-CoA synthetase alpha subunit